MADTVISRAPTEEFLELAGGSVHLLRGGTGEPVLFLHAAGGAGAWHPFHALLADSGFEVLAPDHPGFGKSDDFPDAEAIDDLVYHYLDVIDALGLARPHVVGASFGGWIAAELAVHSPHRIGSLTLWVPYFYDPKLERRLGRITTPALVAAPSDDRLIPVAHARRYAALISGATYAEVPDCGHAMYFERPTEFAALVTSFLASHPLAECGVSR